MQISLRSQMVAGATAFVGAGAIALTPVAPAVNLPALSTSTASVALASFANPVTALINTGYLLGNYTLNGANTTPSQNWPNSGTGDYPAGIGSLVNQLLPTYGVTRPGLVQNFITNPLPVISALAANWSGYGWIALKSAALSVGAVGNILWTIPTTALQLAVDVLTFNFSNIGPTISSAIQSIVGDAQIAVGAIVSGVSSIATSVFTKGAGVVEYLLNTVGALPDVVVGQLGLIGKSLIGVVENTIAAVSQPNPVEGVWNALVGGLLDGLTPGSLPATVINLTQGAGVQASAGSVQPVIPPVFVPSVRTTLTATISGVADVLNGKTPPPLPGAATEASPAAVRAAAAVSEAEVADAPAVDASAARDAVAGDNDAAPAAVAAATADTAAADSAPVADAPAPAKGKAAAHKGGRS